MDRKSSPEVTDKKSELRANYAGGGPPNSQWFYAMAN